MSRRSARLVPGGHYQLDDDAASTSSTGSTGHISYREIPVRIFKKKTGGRRAGSSRSTLYSNISSASLGQHMSDEPIKSVQYWGMVPTQRAGVAKKTPCMEPVLPSSACTEVQGHSSGYSSSEEGYSIQGLGSAQSPAEQEFGFRDAIRSPAAMLFWWLGTTWYSLTSGFSLLDVFLLSRRTPAVTKVVLLFFLFIVLAFGTVYWCPSVSGFFAINGPVYPVPNAAVSQDCGTNHGLSALQNEMRAWLAEREVRWMEERRRERDDEKWRLESMQTEVAQLIQDGQKFKLLSKILETEMSDLKLSIKNGEMEHRRWLGQEMAGLTRWVTGLRSDISRLNTKTDLLKQKVDSQQTAYAKLKAELTDWLMEQLSPGGGSEGLVFRPELQGALVNLEKKFLERLSEDREKQKGDGWRSVGGTLQGGLGAVTVQDVQQIVNRALSLFRADGVGMADYALESSGASVINTRCSETFRTRSACLSLFGFPLWYHSESPRTVIQPELYPGKCWAFRGGQGFLVIALSYPVRISHITLEHLPRVLSPTGRIDSAPRDFAVYGMAHEREEGTLLGTFTYDQDGEPIQTFTLPEPAMEVYRMVELRILSNWGHPEYTCVYRFRVHGQARSG